MDTAGDVVGAEGVVLDFDLPEEIIGVEVMGGEGDLDGAKDTVEVHDDDNVQGEARDMAGAEDVN